ncbi:MAG: hypothetical protein SGPRY_005568, partial [Prymnesium sp.]
VKQPFLLATVIDAQYVKQSYSDCSDVEEEGNAERYYIRQNTGGTAKKLVLDDKENGLKNVKYKDQVKKHVEECWTYGASQFAAAAYVLDPEFRSHDQNVTMRSRALDGRFTVAWEKRRALNKGDPKKQATWTNYPNYPKDDTAEVQKFCQDVSAHVVNYRDGVGAFARKWIIASAECACPPTDGGIRMGQASHRFNVPFESS